MIAAPAFLIALGVCAAASTPPAPAPEEMRTSEGSDSALTARDIDDILRRAVDLLDEPEPRDADAAEALLTELNEHIRSIETEAPTHAWLPYLRGRADALADREGDAIDELRKFVASHAGRNEWRAYRILGDLFLADFPRLARSNYQRAAALAAGQPDVLRGLSICAMKLGSQDEAIRLAREAAAADGRKTIRHIAHLAVLLRLAGRLDEAFREAIHALERALQVVADEPGARAPLRAADNQYQLALSILQRRINESERPVIEDYVELERLARKRGSMVARLTLHQVLRVVESGVEESAPDTPTALVEQYAGLLADVGRTDDAIAECERLLAIAPANPVAARLLRELKAAPPATVDAPE